MTMPRILLGAASVAIIAVVVFTAASLGADNADRWLMFCGLLAVVTALMSAAWDPGDLKLALLFSMGPVLGLLASGSPAWLIGPFAAALLVAAELNALSWECQGATPVGLVNRRLLSIGQLGGLAFAAALVVGLVAGGPAVGGLLGVVLAAGALVALGVVVFARGARAR